MQLSGWHSKQSLTTKMSEIIEQRLSDAFSYLLVGLCVDQFPCGDGRWVRMLFELQISE